MSNTSTSNLEQKTSHFGLYRTVWRWHFYAGIYCIPFVMLLSITGAIYLFKPQYEAWQDRQYLSLPSIPVENDQLNNLAQLQIEKALAAQPGARFQSYQLPQASDSPVKINLHAKGNNSIVIFSPDSLSILAIDNKNQQLMHWVKKIHGELLAGTAGSIFVELAACWAIFLIVSGLYLHWPRNHRGLAGLLYPRLSLSKRMWWKETHAVLGIWISLLVLFLLISGLPWTTVWGGAFKEFRQIGQHQAHQQSWSLSSQERQQRGRAQAVSEVNLTPVVIDVARKLNLAPPVELSVSDSNNNYWKVSSVSQNRTLREEVWIAADSGTILDRSSFENKSIVDQAVGVGISVHEGQLFGWANQLLGLLVAVSLLYLSLSGFIMWQKRKPSQQLGAPQKMLANHEAIKRFSKPWIIILSILILFLPLLLASCVLIILIERLILIRLPKVGNWLGLA